MINEQLKWQRGKPTDDEFANNLIVNAGCLSEPSYVALLIHPGGERGTWWPETWYLVLDVQVITNE